MDRLMRLAAAKSIGDASKFGLLVRNQGGYKHFVLYKGEGTKFAIMAYFRLQKACGGPGNTLVPDRDSNTAAVKKIWMYFYQRRPDVKKTPLQDCRLYNRAGEEYLDVSYTGTKSLGRLVQNHKGFLIRFGAQVLPDLIQAGKRFFGKKLFGPTYDTEPMW